MINAEDLKRELKRIILDNVRESGGDKNNNEVYKKSLQQYGNFIKEHQAELSPDAQNLIDSFIDSIIKDAKESIKNLPDKKETRKLVRLIDILERKHFDINTFIQGLDKETHLSGKIIIETKKLFVKMGQTILDWLHDIEQNTLKTPDVVLLSLFYSAIDELIVSFHLAQHSYAPQTFNHIRTTQEILDKIDLFHEQPQQIELWSNLGKQDKGKFWEEFRPAAVRKKLGKNKYDPIYSFFSELGVHITFEYIQSKVFILEKDDGKKRMKVRINIGGSPSEFSLMSSNSAAIHFLIILLIKIPKIYGKFLLTDEMMEEIKLSSEEFFNYFNNNFVVWAKKGGFNTSEMERFLKENIEQIKNF